MSDAAFVSDMSPRVAVLEEIARGTKAVLDRIEKRLDAIEINQGADFRWLIIAMLGCFGTVLTFLLGLLGVMAHGFHWI